MACLPAAVSLVLLSALVLGCTMSAEEPHKAGEIVVSGAASAARGRLLYENACQECHTKQAHWRDNSIVNTWPELVGQVTRWQKIAGQQWRDEEIVDVAAYLNQQFYRLDCPVPGCAPAAPRASR